MKTVKRKYIKKNGVVSYYEYHYDANKYRPKRGGKNLLLVNKKGKIYEDRLNTILDTIEDPIDRIEVEALVKARSKNKVELKSRTLKSIMEEDRRTKMFINAGYNSLDEAAAEIGVNAIDLINEKNWNGTAFKKPGTNIFYMFNVSNYHGSAWEIK